MAERILPFIPRSRMKGGPHLCFQVGGLEKALKVVRGEAKAGRGTVVLQPSHAAALWGFYRRVIPYNKQNGRHVHMQLLQP